MGHPGRDRDAHTRGHGIVTLREPTKPHVAHFPPLALVLSASRRPMRESSREVTHTPKEVTMPKKPTPADASVILTLYDLRREAEIRKARN